MRAALRHPFLAATLCGIWLVAAGPAHADWRATIIPATVANAILQVGEDAFVATGKAWFRFDPATRRLVPGTPPKPRAAPAGALPDARVAIGLDVVREAWLSDPTTRYGHGVLGDAIEAESLSILRRDGSRAVLRLGADAVFEDIAPRVAQIGGRERIVLVKAYLERGAAIAVIDPVSATIVAESTPIGRANAWRNPAGIADFDGDGSTDIAAVRQPHVVGRLELWSFVDGTLKKTAEVSDVCNHVIGSRALELSTTADFDGDGKPDLAIPSFDRRSLRMIGFAPSVRDIARVALPARVVTDLALVRLRGRPAVLAGLDNGQIVLVHDEP
jgi:hypothetical protein